MFAAYRGKALGSFGAFGAVSFHETKNVISGEGGALFVNDASLVEAAEIAWEKGTDRARFRRGEADRYTWTSLGSSFAPSEVTAAFLWAQLRNGGRTTARRLAQWNRYHAAFEPLEREAAVERPSIPEDCRHNGHLYRLLLPSEAARDAAIAELVRRGVQAIFHYVPLHSSPAGRRFARACGTMRVTEDAARRLVRLPLHATLSESEQACVIEAVLAVCGAGVYS
jgi:dTDP-4-amino-4,6-dideoxygalactose transaminase